MTVLHKEVCALDFDAETRSGYMSWAAPETLMIYPQELGAKDIALRAGRDHVKFVSGGGESIADSAPRCKGSASYRSKRVRPFRICLTVYA